MLPELMKYTGIDATGFYMSEKLNGVRALWNGRDFVSKNGKRFSVPVEMVQAMPQNIVTGLDGELYAGGELGFIAGLCRRKTPAPVTGWQGVTFQVFDIASHAHNFGVRQELLSTRFSCPNSFLLPDFVQPVKQTICRDNDHLQAEYYKIKAKGGEGIVIKSPLHKFRPGESELAQKIKFIDDFEIDGRTFDETGRFICVRDYE